MTQKDTKRLYKKKYIFFFGKIKFFDLVFYPKISFNTRFFTKNVCCREALTFLPIFFDDFLLEYKFNVILDIDSKIKNKIFLLLTLFKTKISFFLTYSTIHRF